MHPGKRLIDKQLDNSARSVLFTRLAKAEQAGLPLKNTLAVLRGDSDLGLVTRLEQFQKQVTSGTDIAQAGLDSGLFLPWEAHLLRAAQESGDLAGTYAELGKRYQGRARRSRQLKSNMLLPLLLFVLAAFIAPILPLYRGEISGIEYLFSSLGRLLLLFGGLFLLSLGWRRLMAYGTESALHKLLLHLPVAGGLVLRQQRFDFLHNLSLLLAAGLPAFDALETAASGISHPTLRRRFKESSKYCRNGMDVVSSLDRCGAFEDADAVALARSGEFSGQLDRMIRHHVTQLGERLDLQYDLLTQWLPRAFYLLILLYLVVT